MRGNSDHIKTLDGLRAVAICIVILSHLTHIGRFGHGGVLIFFALSGFLITARMQREFDSTGTISLRLFYLRRVFRILPAALTYLAVIAILTKLRVIDCSMAAVRGALFFYTNYVEFGVEGWKVGHFWSLSVEEHFYLLWPCIFILAGIRKAWRVPAGLAIAVCIWRAVDSHYGILEGVFPGMSTRGYRTDLIADTLLWGCCLAFFRLRLGPVVSTLVAATAFGLLEGVLAADIGHTAPLVDLLPAVLVGAVVACPNAPIGLFLETAPMRFIGKISYSLYLWQQLFVGELPIPIALVAIFVCAYASYRLIEQPCIRAGRAWTKMPVTAAVGQ
jgi:peptidoglycan/LPS O-acetylase OafA/YrhL